MIRFVKLERADGASKQMYVNPACVDSILCTSDTACRLFFTGSPDNSEGVLINQSAEEVVKLLSTPIAEELCAKLNELNSSGGWSVPCCDNQKPEETNDA